MTEITNLLGTFWSVRFIRDASIPRAENVRADEKLIAFLKLEAAVRSWRQFDLTRFTDENRRWIRTSGVQRRWRPTRELSRSARASVTGTSRTRPHGEPRRVLNTR